MTGSKLLTIVIKDEKLSNLMTGIIACMVTMISMTAIAGALLFA
jgi:hypothetical protein